MKIGTVVLRNNRIWREARYINHTNFGLTLELLINLAKELRWAWLSLKETGNLRT